MLVSRQTQNHASLTIMRSRKRVAMVGFFENVKILLSRAISRITSLTLSVPMVGLAAVITPLNPSMPIRKHRIPKNNQNYHGTYKTRSHCERNCRKERYGIS